MTDVCTMKSSKRERKRLAMATYRAKKRAKEDILKSALIVRVVDEPTIDHPEFNSDPSEDSCSDSSSNEVGLCSDQEQLEIEGIRCETEEKTESYYYLCYVVHKRLNRNQLVEREYWATMNSTRFIIKTTSAQVISRLKKESEFLSPRFMSICHSCEATMDQGTSRCRNILCVRYNSAPKADKDFDKFDVFSYSLINNLENVLQFNGGRILEMHKEAHKNVDRDEIAKKGFVPTSTSKSRFFLENIETETEFRRGVLKVPLSIQYDGFVPKRSRKECIPFYICIESLPEDIRNKPWSYILPLVSVGRQNPSKGLQRKMLTRILEEANVLSTVPIVSLINGQQFKFYFHIVRAYGDLKGISDFHGTPKWKGKKSRCHKCDTKPIFNGQNVLFSRKGTSYNATNPSEKDETPLGEVVDAHNYGFDKLHTLELGLCKDVIEELINGGKLKFSGMKLGKTKIARFDSVMSKLEAYTYRKVPFTSIGKSGKRTGSETATSCRTSFPLLVLWENFSNPSAAVFLLGVSLLLYLLDRKEDDLTWIRDTLRCLQEIHVDMAKSFTLKSHLIYQHLIEDLSYYGWPMGDTKPMEKNHQMMQAILSPFSRNGQAFMIERFAISHSIFNKFLAENHEEDEHKDLDSVIRGERVERFKVDKEICPGVYIPTRSAFTIEQMGSEAKLFVDRYSGRIDTFSRRICCNGFVFTVADSEKETQLRSDQSHLMFMDNNNTRFGRLLCIFEDRTIGYACYVKEYITLNPEILFSEMKESVTRSPSCVKHLLQMTIDYPYPIVAKVREHRYRIVSPSDIIGYCEVLSTVRDGTFVIPM